MHKVHEAVALSRNDYRMMVCEGGGLWTSLFRRLLAGARVRQVDDILAMRAEMTNGTTDVFALDLAYVGVERAISFVTDLRSRPQSAVAIVLSSNDQLAEMWMVREAGAVAGVTDYLHVPRICRLVKRHFRRLSRARTHVSDVPGSVLPWAE